MIPVVALIGRQNVGKSTLFNRLTHSSDALVADVPGLTRDRKYGHAKLEGYEFIVIDTAGIADDYQQGPGIETSMALQSLIAIDHADIVLFIVDSSTGLMVADYSIAKYLRSRRKKPTVLVANKIDVIERDTYSRIGEFYSIGMGDICPIGAYHGRGINRLLKTVLFPLLERQDYANSAIPNFIHQLPPQQPQPEQRIIKLAIVGRPNVGKSMLINCLLGEDRVVVYDRPGTTRDSIYIMMVRNQYKYVLIDTAGVRTRTKVKEKIEYLSVLKTQEAIVEANVVLLVIDASEGLSDQDLSLLSRILKLGKSLVIVVNKWDSITTWRRAEVKEQLKHRLSFIEFVRVHFVSALKGSGISNLFTSVTEAYRCASKRISTARLTRIMHLAVNEHPPQLIRGLRIKPKYAHMGGYHPPIIVIHGTKVTYLPNTYQRYLIHYFRRSFKINGTPIRIQFKE